MERKNLPFRINCEGYFLDSEGNIIAKESKGIILFPGGGVDKNEEITKAMIRETKEETSAVVKNIRKLGKIKIVWGPNWAKTEKQKSRYRAFQGDEMYFFIGEIAKFGYKKIIKKLTKTSFKDMLDKFTANFTYENNAIEGNSLTLKDVAMVMFENASIKGKDLREIYETRNSRKVAEFIFKNRFNISHKKIIKIHRLLIRDINIKEGYKEVPNVIIGSKIKTTPPEKVYEEMSKLIQWYKKEKEKIHPLKLAALFHGKFEQIHPFEDGNGRVGRFLINIILLKSKYPPLIIRKTQRVSYLKALENFDNKHPDTLERLILERFKETYRKFFGVYIKYI